MQYYRRLLLICGASLLQILTIGQPVSVDIAFDSGPSRALLGEMRSGERFQSLAIQRDGKILIGGSFSGGSLARLNTDGSVDRSFNIGDGFEVTGTWFYGNSSGLVSKIVVLDDGKILVGGHFNEVNGSKRVNLVRLNPDGSLDRSFFSIGSNNSISDLSVGPTGTIAVGGNFTHYGEKESRGIELLRTDGNQVVGFNAGTGADGEVNAVLMQPDGKVVLGGSFKKIDNRDRSAVARFSSEGIVDYTFRSEITDGSIRDLEFDQFGGIIVGGRLKTSDQEFLLVRLTQGGRIDKCFTPLTGEGRVESIGVQSDGKIVATGSFLVNGDIQTLIRLFPDGSIDSSFRVEPDRNDSTALAVDRDSDSDALVMAGYFKTIDNLPVEGLTRLITGESTNLPTLELKNRVCRDGDVVRLTLWGKPGTEYGVQRSSDLTTWEDWSTGNLAISMIFLTDSFDRSGPQQFYRLKPN